MIYVFPHENHVILSLPSVTTLPKHACTLVLHVVMIQFKLRIENLNTIAHLLQFQILHNFSHTIPV